MSRVVAVVALVVVGLASQCVTTCLIEDCREAAPPPSCHSSSPGEPECEHPLSLEAARPAGDVLFDAPEPAPETIAGPSGPVGWTRVSARLKSDSSPTVTQTTVLRV